MLNLKYTENGLDTARLSFKENSFLTRLKARPKVVSILPIFAKERVEVERFIIDVYAEKYGAKIEVHYSVLMSVRDENGKILAATGFRAASDDVLFLEQYLNAPIEFILKTPRTEMDILAYRPYDRDVIVVEVKSLFDSPVFKVDELLENHRVPQGRFKIFTCENYRAIVLNRLRLVNPHF